MTTGYLEQLRYEIARVIATGAVFPFNEDGTIAPVKLAKLTAVVAELNAYEGE